MNTINKYKNNKLLIAALLVFSCLAAYYPILENRFLDHWDDQWQVFNQYTEGGLNFYNLVTIFTDYYGGQYSPVNEVMYLLLYSLGGYNPFLFHLASLLLHVANTLLVWILVRRLFSNTAHIKEVSVLTALTFALHPLNVEPIAWISASKIPVYAVFYLSAAIVYLKYMETAKKRYYIWTFLLFALSFFGKEQAVVFPVFLLLMYWIKGFDIKGKKVWLGLLPFFAMAIAFGLITMLSQRNGANLLSFSQPVYPLWQRVVFGSYALTEYIVKFVAPVRLMYMYPYPMQVGEILPPPFWAYPLLPVLIFMSFYRLVSENKALCFGLLFFVVNLLLALNIIPMSRFVTITADRYMYLSVVGLGFIVSYYWVGYIKCHAGIRKKAATVLLAGYFLFMGIYSNLRCRDWYDTDSIKKEIRELIETRDDYETGE